MQFQSNLGKKNFQDPISMEKKLGIMACTCHPSDNWKLKIERLQSRPTQTKSETLAPK
jgi:hypothetical protein